MRIAMRMQAEPGVTFTADQAQRLVGSVQNPTFGLGLQPYVEPGLYLVEQCDVLDDGAALWVVLRQVGHDS